MHHRALDRNKLQLQKAPASAFQQLKSTCIHPNSVIILDTFIFLFVNLSYSEDCIEQPDLKRRFLSLFKSPLRAPKLTWNLQVQLQDWDNYQCRYYKTICFSLLFFFFLQEYINAIRAVCISIHNSDPVSLSFHLTGANALRSVILNIVSFSYSYPSLQHFIFSDMRYVSTYEFLEHFSICTSSRKYSQNGISYLNSQCDISICTKSSTFVT